MNRIDDLLSHNTLLKRGSDAEFHFSRIPFGIEALDDLVGGGIPRKRITLLVGQPNAGKSYLASQVAVSAQKSNSTVVWIDLELSWDDAWMKRCGIDIDNIIVTQPTTAEETFDLIKSLMVESVDLIVLDSVAGLVPASIQEEGFDYNPIAWQARFVNSSLPKLLPYLKNGSAFIAINQLRSSIGPVSLDTMPGGLAQGYFSHFVLDVRRHGWIDEGQNKKVGFDMEIRCKKSKVGGRPFQSCIVPFRLDGGIDMLEVQLREAISKGLIVQRGPWYKINWVDKKIVGLNGLRKYFREHEEERNKLSEEVVINP